MEKEDPQEAAKAAQERQKEAFLKKFVEIQRKQKERSRAERMKLKPPN